MPSSPVKAIAIQMAERTRASKDSLSYERTQINGVINDMMQAATRKKETDVIAFASKLADLDLDEIDIYEPITIIIGDYLRLKSLPSQ